MRTLKELKDWARKEGIVSFTRMSKAELFELWEESQPEEPRKVYYFHQKFKKLSFAEWIENKPLSYLRDMKSNLKKTKVFVKDKTRKLFILGKKIAERFKETKLVVEKRKSALKGLATEFFIKGNNDLLPKEFFRKAKPLVVDLMKNNPRTKAKTIWHCLLVKTDLNSGEEDEADPFFHSGYHPNSQETNRGEIFDDMEEEMFEKLETFNKNGSNWQFKKRFWV